MPRSSERPGFLVCRPPVSAFFLVLAGLAHAPAALPSGSGAQHSTRGFNGDFYALSVGKTMTSTNISLDEYVRLDEKRAGDFLWFRRSGKTGLITDFATLKEAAALLAPLRALEPEQEDLRRREQALEKEERKLDRQEEKLDRLMDLASGEDEDLDEGDAAARSPDADVRELETRLDQIRSRQRQLEARERELDSIERSLDAREEAIEREAEAKLWTLIDSAVEKGLARPAAAR